MTNFNDDNGAKLHVTMFPWLAFGHIVPFLELSKLMVQKGHTVSFISTPRNIDRLLPRLPVNLSSAVNFVKLPLPRGVVNKLPEDGEATSDVPLDLVPYLKIAYDGLQIPVTEFLESSRPHWVLHDFAPYWLPAISRRLGIKTVFFSIITAASLGTLKPPGFEEYRTSPVDFLTPPKWVPFQTSVAFRLFECRNIFEGVMADSTEGNVPDVHRLAGVMDGCDVIAVRSCYEYESEWLGLVQDLYRKPVIPVGVLPPKPEVFEDTDTWLSIKRWLDSQKTKSVVYVAFGSEAKPSQTELNEIALGLELSGLPFFWVLKTRRGEWDTKPVELPEGFEERTAERGMVWRGWVEQLRILSHDSIGLVLTHAGWGTIIEAVRFAKPTAILVFLNEQGLNARVIEEKKIGYMIPRDDKEGFFTKESVAESLRLVMEDEEGKVYRENVKDMKGVFGDMDTQDRYVDSFLDYLGAHR